MTPGADAVAGPRPEDAEDVMSVFIGPEDRKPMFDGRCGMTHFWHSRFTSARHGGLPFAPKRVMEGRVMHGRSARISLTHPLPTEWSSQLLSVLRIVTAFLFMAHGTQKLFAFPAAGPPKPIDLTSLIGVAGVLEVVGGTLLLVGLLSRPIAFLLSGEMAFAYFMRHAPNGFWPVLNGGELAVLYCFLFLFVAAAGPGVWSLDEALVRSRRRRWFHPLDHRRRWAA